MTRNDALRHGPTAGDDGSGDPPVVEHLFYDGGCGVCHGAVRFVARRDDGGAFRFAPLGGETFRRIVPADARDALPDSLVVATADGAVLTRTAATIHLLRRLGGGWRVVAFLLRCIPRRLRDAAYDLFARHRGRFAAKPSGTCPLVPPELARRFDP